MSEPNEVIQGVFLQVKAHDWASAEQVAVAVTALARRLGIDISVELPTESVLIDPHDSAEHVREALTQASNRRFRRF